MDGITHPPETHTSREVESQPDLWRRAAALAPAARAAVIAPGERVAYIGCGTSWFVSQMVATLRERAGAGESDAFVASEAPLARGYDRVVAFTRSGTTTEVVEALQRAPARSATVVVTAVSSSPVAEVAGAVIALDFADERSVVQTRFATTAIMLLRAGLGEDVEPAAQDAERALLLPLPADPGTIARVQFLGSGWCAGLAAEAALKLREAAQAWAEAYPAMDYRHGPIAVADPQTLVWFFGTPPVGLVEQVELTGATVYTSGLDPVAQLVLAQRFALGMAHARGLDPDHPRHLTRSVVLGS
jgi:fructoselysine-6-P-deglycase FrlB-like protein